MDTEKKSALYEAANIQYLTKENFKAVKRGEFVGAKITKDGETKEHSRVWLHRSFPFDMPFGFISVQDKDGEELGLVKDVAELDENSANLVKAELDRKYYTPVVKRIVSLKEARGASFWKCETDAGELSFTLQDTHRSIARVGEDRAFITDVCGNRYEIKSIEALDKRSLRKLEIYL